MKFLIVISLFASAVVAQRPTYAGTGPKGRPGLASRFKDNDTESATLANRFADGSTPKIPVDARGDYDLVDRLNQWPREHRPFWLLNADHIEASRNRNVQNGNNAVTSQNNQAINSNESNQRFIPDGNNEGILPVDNYSGSSFQSRSNFDFEPYPIQRQDSIPVRPTPPRSSFLGPLN